MYPWRRDDVETDDLASAEVAEDAEWDETEEKVRSGEEYEEMAGVAGTEGEGDVERTGGEDRSSTSCGSMAISETGVAAPVQWGFFDRRGMCTRIELDRNLGMRESKEKPDRILLN
jgi:hypothetical protein